jgi:hypothetical protein
VLRDSHHRASCPWPGRQVTLRLEPTLLHVIADGRRDRLRGARIAGPQPALADAPVRVQRRVSCRGGFQVVGQRVQVGFRHAGATVTVEVDDTVLRILDEHDQIITVVARTTPKEVTRYKAYGHSNRAQA